MRNNRGSVTARRCAGGIKDQLASRIVVEHKDRLTRFGFRYLETRLELQGRNIEVVNVAENDQEDLIADLVAMVSSFTARLYGQRRARRQTEAIVAQLKQEGTGEPGRATSHPQG